VELSKLKFLPQKVKEFAFFCTFIPAYSMPNAMSQKEKSKNETKNLSNFESSTIFPSEILCQHNSKRSSARGAMANLYNYYSQILYARALKYSARNHKGL